MSEEGNPVREKETLSYKVKERKDSKKAANEVKEALEEAKENEPEPVVEHVVEAEEEK